MGLRMENYTKSVIALGSTSALALMAAADVAKADGFYVGLFGGSVSGSHPTPGSSDEAYRLAGPVVGGFVGIDRAVGDNGMFVGAELAFTGPFEGDADNSSSYEYAYDINYNLDAKLRIGRTFSDIGMGDLSVYGFSGVSMGEADGCCYGNSYRYYGLNAGVGVQLDIFEDFFVGAEYINRFATGTFDGEDGYRSSHGAFSIRAGVRF